MKFCYGVIALASLFFFHMPVSAAPTEKRGILSSPFETLESGGVTFKVQQVPSRKSHISQTGKGAMAMARAYFKYGASLPDDLITYLEQILPGFGSSSKPGAGNGITASLQGEVAATPAMFDSEYLCPVQIGTPPQTLHLDLDTGSSDFWVFSTETPKSQINGQTVYNISQSSTAKPLQGESWQISYGDGSSSSGNVYLDTVSVGGVTVTDQAVESAINVSLAFTQRPDTDGLVGLAFGTLNTVSPDKQRTFFDNAMRQLAAPVFTANLKSAEPGNYNFGFIDASEFTGQITYVPTNTSAGLWQFPVQGFKIGNTTASSSLKTAATETDIVVSQPHDAIADTGTTLLLVPEAIAVAYYAQIPGAINAVAASGGWVFPCGAGATIPSFTALIGPYEAVVPGEFIIFAPVDGRSFADATTCFGGIQAVPKGIPFAIYGDVFLKSQFVVFDNGNRQLGFAPKPL
ncbi:eukaryotic aspartyl protease [Nemania sp. FL0916]|nr:eukaryotic aspartyl protease [Nemania sp. FL0916]